jgi:Zn finger protein HypA/HybF involved in hydrogenase expression
MEEPKLTEMMWCYQCEHEWETNDYLNCDKCPNCTTEPIQILRQSSTSFVYAYMAKKKVKIVGN